ncbi:MAG TPA: methyltransferase domain-containing protein [Candidatus Paceibacterota bacterium]
MNFSDPRSNVLQLGLKDGMKVAEFGAGSGHWVVAAAHAVGHAGRVYAIDIQEELLGHVKDVAHRAGLRNVETIWGNVERPGGTKLRPQTLDAGVLANTLFQLEHKEAAFAEIKRVMKPGGKLLVVDWAGAYGGMGPDTRHVVSEQAAEKLCIEAGFHKVKSFRAGAHHYAIVVAAP